MLRVIVIAGFTFLFTLACSSTSEEAKTPEEELAQTEGDPAVAEEPPIEEIKTEPTAEAADHGIADLDNVAKEMKPSEFLSSALGQPAQAPAETAPATAVTNENRVVRFVAVDGAQAFDSPNDKGQVIGKYTQGDAVVVVLQEGWASVNTNRFIKLSDLSESIVKRPKNDNPWHK